MGNPTNSMHPRNGQWYKDDGAIVNLADLLSADGVFVRALLADGGRAATDTHTRIHRGGVFSIDTTTPGASVSIANGASLSVAIVPDADNYPHVTFMVKLGGKGRFLLYELANNEAVTAGTAMVPANKKWGSEATLAATATKNPTVDLTGATFKEGCIILGATGAGQSRTGSDTSFDDEVIVTPGKPFYLQVINESGAAVDACICLDAYNAPEIPDR